MALLAGADSGVITPEEAANPAAINWQALMAFVMALLQVLLPLINPPKPGPAPTPSLPAGSGQ